MDTSSSSARSVPQAADAPPVEAERATALPNLIVIGAQKCGTSSVHRYLELHPQVAMSRPKELSFFMIHTDPSEVDVEAYKAHFPADADVRGESSPNYTCYPEVSGVPERIHRLIPGTKLIYLVRDPVERAISEYVHAHVTGDEERQIDEALDDPDTRYVARGRYHAQLEQYLPYFDLSRIMVIDQEELLNERGETMGRVYAFVGVDDSFRSPQFERMWEVTSGKGRRYKVAFRASRMLGGHRVWGRLPTGVRWLGERVVFGAGTEDRPSKPDLDPAVRERLADRFREDARKLRELTGNDFAGWSV